jgi:ankyrin repeat protein
MYPGRQSAVSPSHIVGPTYKEIKTTSHQQMHIGSLYSTATSRLASRSRSPKATTSLIEASDASVQAQAIEAVVSSLTEYDQQILSTKTFYEDNDGCTPLHLAAQSDSSRCVYSLLQNSTGIDANIQDNDGRTPFQAVAFLDREDLVPELLERSADPSKIKEWWQSWQDSSTKKEIPGYLRLWENAANGFDYGTIDTLVKNISIAEDHVTFGSIV